MHAFTVHSEKKAPASSKLAGTSKRRTLVRAGAIMLLLVGIACAVWATLPNRHVKKAQALREELFSEKGKSLPPEERIAKFDALKTEMAQLTDEQKAEMFAPMREKRKAEMKQYFTMSPEEKTRTLDERIDRDEKRRQERVKDVNGNPIAGLNSSQNGGAGANGGGGRGLATSPGNPIGASGKMGDSAPTSDDILKRRKERLDNSTPEERAQMDLYRKEMRDRREARGLNR